MKNDVLCFVVVFLGCFLLGECLNIEEIVNKRGVHLVGEKECTYGPSFWCKNITTASGCKAVKHCIQTTWLNQKYQEDNDDVCTICKNMVQEARDTLTSNGTMEEIQQVFYGSCNLLPLKIVKVECKKLADEFIPELVDTLASEMDPNVVCTVSGLCNNDRIDKLLQENHQKKKLGLDFYDEEYHSCEKCAVVMEKLENMIQTHSKQDILHKIWNLCGELSTFSDACSAIVLKNFDAIYDRLKTGFNKKNVCMLSGMCSEAFHPHADGYKKSQNAMMGVEISSAGERGIISSKQQNKVGDDLTCEFCEQLVKHLRDILISNSTEEEFYDVLKGLCKQTGSFSQECLSLVDQNYKVIYTFLTSELDGKVVCKDVGICPTTLTGSMAINYKNQVPLFPLLPNELLEKVSSFKKEGNVQTVEKSPVIDVIYENIHVKVNKVDLPKDKTACFVCDSILHYVQQAVTDPKSEAEIRSALESSCTVLPKSFSAECKQFVDQYGDAFISLVAQEVDPSIICPELKLCPVKNISLVSDTKSSEACPMCVMFMSALKSEITNKDNEAEITKKLEKLCSKLPSHWKKNCTSLVDTNFQQIIDMITAELTPQEICTLLKICEPASLLDYSGDIETNMIAKTDKVTIVFPGLNIGQMIINDYKMPVKSKVPTPFCLICTVLMKYLNKVVEDKSNQESIKNVIDSACKILPNVEENECIDFVNQHYSQIIMAVETATDPGIACMAMLVCVEAEVEKPADKTLQVSKAMSELDFSSECVVCEAFVKVLDRNSKKLLGKADEIDLVDLCDEIDAAHKEKCLEMVPSYGQTFQNLYYQVPTWMMCEKITMCDKNKSAAVNQLENSDCLLGFSYWCSSKENAKSCKAEKICERNTWKVQIIEN
ncbi:prosaposin isoform X2 [Daktulosphaira vitifoliae]|uniref:prosaposin isoform X2 n=1 Tax=Daktulosphaira vitifoliae TaxID=58002 RepID=UPI0021AA40E2|nr:prosaposin isoform X2 [Daktulosphaira vitifoliae]